jgi:hypothetical protein
MKLTGQQIVDRARQDKESLAEAIDRHKDEKARRDPLLVDQGKMEGGLDEPKV